MSHTPGPWRDVERHGEYMLIGPNDEIVCDPYLPNPQDARLIAAAPDLLEALKAAEQFIHVDITRGPTVNGWQNTVDMVAAAIAKAEGQ